MTSSTPGGAEDGPEPPPHTPSGTAAPFGSKEHYAMTIRLDWVLIGLVVLATFAVFFLVGLVAAESGLLPGFSRVPRFAEESQDLNGEQTLPRRDVPGRDMPGIERYPGAVRIKYERYDLGGTEVIEVGYVTGSRSEEVSTFYGEVMQSNGWRYVGSDTEPGDELGLLVTKGEGQDQRRIFVEIAPLGEFVSIELEETVASPTSRVLP